jgi:hypothetical protein
MTETGASNGGGYVNPIIENRSELPAKPSSIMPELSFDALRERAGSLAERRLIIAVLEDAVMCYQKYMRSTARHDRRVFDQAEAWLMRHESNSSADRFSFEFICDALGLDTESLRQQLRRWRDQETRKHSPFVSSRQRCRWRAVYREPVKHRLDEAVPGRAA